MYNAEKNALRRDMRARLKAIPPEEIRAQSEALCKKIIAHAAYRNADTILGWWPMQGEADLRPVLEHAWAHGKTAALPRCKGGVLAFCAVEAFNALEPGVFGILEPCQTCPMLEQFENTLVLTPALAYTAKGERLGRGKAYYDRFLAALPGSSRSMGAALREQIVANIPVEAHDIILDFILTWEGELWPNN